MGPVMVTVGRVRFASTETWLAAALLPLPESSVATSAATSMVTVPVADGVMVAV